MTIFIYHKEGITAVAAVGRSDSRLWRWLAYLVDQDSNCFSLCGRGSIIVVAMPSASDKGKRYHSLTLIESTVSAPELLFDLTYSHPSMASNSLRLCTSLFIPLSLVSSRLPCVCLSLSLRRDERKS
jgi:hypothetical protein